MGSYINNIKDQVGGVKDRIKDVNVDTVKKKMDEAAVQVKEIKKEDIQQKYNDYKEKVKETNLDDVKSKLLGMNFKDILRNKKLLFGAVGFCVTAFASLSFLFGGGKTTYDQLINNQEFVDEINVTHQKFMNNIIFANYLKAVIKSPDHIITKLKAGGADKNVLEFSEKNKQFVYKIVHDSIMGNIANLTNVSTREMTIVTDYINSPKAWAATTQMELQMEYQIMRAYQTYSLWENKLKDDVDFSNYLKIYLDSFLKVVNEQ